MKNRYLLRVFLFALGSSCLCPAVLTPGKIADMVILSENPLTADPARLTDIRVLETIKNGRRAYRREIAALAQ